MPLDAPQPEEAEAVAEEVECLICQEEMSKERVAQLICGHIFHKSCISSWLKRKASCPMYASLLQVVVVLSKQQLHQNSGNNLAEEESFSLLLLTMVLVRGQQTL